MNLNLEKQVDNVVFGEIFDSNDFKDQMNFVAQDENHRNEQFMATTCMQVFDVFQLEEKSNAQDGSMASKAHVKEKDRWAERKSKIKIGLDLGQDKANQQWKLLD